jgi:hypothetical protein
MLNDEAIKEIIDLLRLILKRMEQETNKKESKPRAEPKPKTEPKPKAPKEKNKKKTRDITIEMGTENCKINCD